MQEPTDLPIEETLDPDDWDAVRALGHRILDDAFDHVAGVRGRRVWTPSPRDLREQRFAGPPPAGPERLDAIYDDYRRHVLPHQLGNDHPRFWGWVAGCGTVAGMLAELLTASTDAVSGAFAWCANNYVELQVLDWLKAMLGYPAFASGVLTSGGSASNLIGLAVARDAGAGFDVRRAGVGAAPGRLVVYASVEAHSSVQKAVELLGLGSESLHLVPVDGAMRIDVAALRAAIAADRAAGRRPLSVIGVAGTTNTGSVDDLPALAGVCREERLWFHVDGAFGAWAALVPGCRHLVAGMEQADSLAFDLHKWMYLQYPVGCVLVRDAEAHRRAFSLTPTYLAHGDGDRGLTAVDVPWASDYGYELSRGFPALKAWMTIREHGTARLGRVIEQNIEQARHLGRIVDAAPELELALPVALNVVCFRYVRPDRDGTALDDLNKRIEVELQERGIAVPSTVTLQGRRWLHVAVTNHRSRSEDLELLAREVIRIGAELTGADPAEGSQV